MRKTSGEQISALVDDELAEAEFELVLRRLTADAEVRGKWQRYHLANEALRNGLSKTVDLTFADRVNAHVAAESEHQVPMAARTWGLPAKGLAVAASVAIVFLTGALLIQDQPGDDSQLAVVEADDPVELPAETRVAEAPQVVRDRWQPDSSQKVYPYLANHSQLATSGTFPAVLPYVRMIGYESPR
jgi:sigma-E factor negative regulatory protein RseA